MNEILLYLGYKLEVTIHVNHVNVRGKYGLHLLMKMVTLEYYF